MRVFIDGSGWRALLIPSDQRHEQVRRLFADLLDNNARIFTHNVAIGQTMDQVRLHLGPDAVGRFSESIEEAYTGSHLSILWIGRRTQKEALRLFKARKHPELGLFDCAAVHLMHRRRIRAIVTEKAAFRELGFRVLPEEGAAV